MDKKNNLFDFATKELSQDAFICWCINWANEPESCLYELGVDVLKMLGVTSERINGIRIVRQYKKIDILVIIPEERSMLLIEDKTFTSEHGNQIRKYVEEIKKYGVYLPEEDREEDSSIISGHITGYNIKTVYFKTGFHYDNDIIIGKQKRADIIIDGDTFLNAIQKYRDKSDIVRDYVSYLENLLNWYKKHGEFTEHYKNGNWYVTRDYIAQYKLMKVFFGSDEYNTWQREKERYYVYSGSSYGLPWTQMIVVPDKKYENSEDTYKVFWRIDSDKNGPYLSLRLYEDMNKNDNKLINRHEEKYKQLKEKLKEIVSNTNMAFSWDKKCDVNKGRYKESSLITISLDYYLSDWQNKGKKFEEDIRLLTKLFINSVE